METGNWKRTLQAVVPDRKKMSKEEEFSIEHFETASPIVTPKLGRFSLAGIQFGQYMPFLPILMPQAAFAATAPAAVTESTNPWMQLN